MSTIEQELTNRIDAATAEDPMVAAQAAAADFLVADELAARAAKLRSERRDRVIATYKAAGVTRLAGVLLTATKTRSFSVAAVLRLKSKAAQEALLVQTVPTSNVDAALKAGVITERQYRQILAGVTEGDRVEACVDSGTTLAA